VRINEEKGLWLLLIQIADSNEECLLLIAVDSRSSEDTQIKNKVTS